MELIGKILFVLFINITFIGFFAILLLIFTSMFDNYLRSAYSKSAAKFRWRDKSQSFFQKIFLTKQLDKISKFQYFVFLLCMICCLLLMILVNVYLITGKLYFNDFFKFLYIIILLSLYFAVSKKRIPNQKIKRKKL